MLLHSDRKLKNRLAEIAWPYQTSEKRVSFVTTRKMTGGIEIGIWRRENSEKAEKANS
jgi:hypothetical protein